MTSLPNYVPFNYCPPTPFRNLFTAATDDALDLLAKLLKFNPLERLTASEVWILHRNHQKWIPQQKRVWSFP